MAMALKTASPTIPVVGVVADPIAYGLTTSVARPVSNFTGVSVDAGIELVRGTMAAVGIPQAKTAGGALLRGLLRRLGVEIIDLWAAPGSPNSAAIQPVDGQDG